MSAALTWRRWGWGAEVVQGEKVVAVARGRRGFRASMGPRPWIALRDGGRGTPCADRAEAERRLERWFGPPAAVEDLS